MVFSDKISNICPVFCENIAVFVLNVMLYMKTVWEAHS